MSAKYNFKLNSRARRGFIILAFIFTANSQDYWQQRLHYDMDIKLVPDEKAVYGESIITYINNSPDTLSTLYLNLYPNAFKLGSVKHQEFLRAYGSLGRAVNFTKGLESVLHTFEVTSFEITGIKRTSSTDHHIDDTVLGTDIPDKLPPGDSCQVSIHWKHVNGDMFERSGVIGDQYNMAQWYPKPMVYDEDGWHINPFHAEGEFYGEFGTFEVTFDLPEAYIIGASGVVIVGNPGWEEVTYDTSMKISDWVDEYYADRDSISDENRRHVTFLAEDVHDFAWVASKNFIYENAVHDGIDFHVLYNKKNASSWSKKVMERSIRSMDWLKQFGTYPYPQVTITDRLRGGGMEYPMLVMNGSARESLIAHELGHIWFYGILANNEIDAAWLDEGFTSFQTGWYLEEVYPPYGIDFSNPRWDSFQKKHGKFISDSYSDQWSTIDLQTSGYDEPLHRRSYQYSSGSVYRRNVYTKGSVMLNELRHLLGDSLFIAGMKNYYNKWNLKHVNDQRFTHAFEQTVGKELDWFFDPWLYDTQVLDYTINSVDIQSMNSSTWSSEIVLNRKGERFFPIPVSLISEDGDTVTVRTEDHPWDFTNTLVVETPFKPKRVVADLHSQTSDIDLRNNHWGRMPSEYSLRWANSNYKPRNAFHVTWFPLIDYHSKDGWLPGISLERKYHTWERNRLDAFMATESGRFYWHLDGSRKFHYGMQGMRLRYEAYDFGGHAFGMVSLQKQWNQWNGRPNKHAGIGTMISHVKDEVRAPGFEQGQVVRFFGYTAMNLMGIQLSTRLDIAPEGWSDWGFSKVKATLTQSNHFGLFSFSSRLFVGQYWFNSTLPRQEYFHLEGANPYERYHHGFLRHPESFYGYTDVYDIYHLTGDGNIRGFTGRNIPPAESIVTSSMEAGFRLPVSFLNTKLYTFADVGLIGKGETDSYSGGVIGAGGIGVEMKKSIVHKRFSFRVDKPFWSFWDLQGLGEQDISTIVIGFSSGI